MNPVGNGQPASGDPEASAITIRAIAERTDWPATQDHALPMVRSGTERCRSHAAPMTSPTPRMPGLTAHHRDCTPAARSGPPTPRRLDHPHAGEGRPSVIAASHQKGREPPPRARQRQDQGRKSHGRRRPAVGGAAGSRVSGPSGHAGGSAEIRAHPSRLRPPGGGELPALPTDPDTYGVSPVEVSKRSPAPRRGAGGRSFIPERSEL